LGTKSVGHKIRIMKLNRQNTKKRRPNNFPEVRRNKGHINNRHRKTPKKKQEKIAKIRKPIRRKRYLIKETRPSKVSNRKIKIALAILLAILVLLLGLIK